MIDTNKFNINDPIYIQITEIGYEHLRNTHNQIILMLLFKIRIVEK